MADGDHADLVLTDQLWDSEGREFCRKHSAWLSRKQAGSFASRDGVVVGLVVSPGRPIEWMTGVELVAWWRHAKQHFDQPGRVDARPDAEGRTWTAHLWRRDDERLLVFDQHC